LKPALEAHLSHGGRAGGFFNEIKEPAINRGRKFEAIGAVQVDLPGGQGCGRRPLASVQHVDPQHFRVEAILLARDDDRRMRIAILGVEPDPDDFPLVDG